MNSIIEQQVTELGIEAYLEQHQNKSLLRFMTCGSVDDGKSSLIGRLLYDTHQIYKDQLDTLQIDSQKIGKTGDKYNLALLVDGLQAEREQGITIDVAYRYFSTQIRKFIIADTPGHKQYTRNMASGASTCDLAVILIDACKGVLDQTRRHSYIASILGIRHFIVAVNKMDLVDFEQSRFYDIKTEYLKFSDKLNQKLDIHFVPLSALNGDNVVECSIHTPWYEGATLLNMLEFIDVSAQQNIAELRFPIQYVNRPNPNFRGFSGTIAIGKICPGDEVKVLPSGKISTVSRIVTFDGDLKYAHAGQTVTLTLADEIDISRGDLIVLVDDKHTSTNKFSASIVWMSEAPLKIGHQYNIKVAGKKTMGSVSKIHYQVDTNSLDPFDTDSLNLNGIAECELSLIESVPLDLYQDCVDTGGFILIDRLTNVTVGGGMITELLDNQISKSHETDISNFEIEFNALILKYFPDWNTRDISKFLG
ncbi:sulfate adenylyltransferase subunit CysN [Candidatus Enterovibrio escicola]|uniref:sulfate adenylyltransferase subunit CysN n=1 Tax=Candidatus Enterovibrio escicola TaxID=1927127 RepID=UPI001237C518|nr:sulfate adenylyltransferase subunit CysN [Candidatus Enterovibrio escacola]